MDAATLSAGFETALTAFTTNYGPVVLTIVGIGLGLWGLSFAIGYLKTHVRVRQSAAR